MNEMGMGKWQNKIYGRGKREKRGEEPAQILFRPPRKPTWCQREANSGLQRAVGDERVTAYATETPIFFNTLLKRISKK